MDVNKVDLKSLLDSCRTCMTKNISMIGLFDNSSNNIIEEITFCTGVTLTQEANLPEKICVQCLKSLSVAHKFKRACLLADETFHKLLDDNMKCEPIQIIDVEFDGDVEIKKELDHVYYGDKIKIEIELPVENKLNQRSTTKARRIIPLTTTKSNTVTNKSIKPSRLKKYKFKKLHCESCDIKFDNKQECTQHKKEFHKNNEHWVCEICGKLFIHRASHYAHVRSHMPPKYSCHQCDYKTSHKHDLVKHIRTHTGVKVYQCEYCTASYSASSNLSGHIRRHHINTERPFPCTQCDLSFFDRTKLNRHMDTHNEIKRFTCDVCHACFTRRCHWKRHLLKQHDIITPPQRPGRQKTNAIVGEYLIENKINNDTESVTQGNTDLENNKSSRYMKRKDLQKVNVLSEDLIQKANVISEDLIQKQNVLSEHVTQKTDVISENLIQKGDVISEDLTQKDIKMKLATVAEFLILNNYKKL